MSFHDDLRYVLDGLKSIETLRNREFLNELTLVLLQLSEEYERVSERASGLARRVADLEERTLLVAALVERDGALWRPGTPEPGPYCRTCWGADRRLVLMVPADSGNGVVCPRCRSAG